ncbi:MAG: 5' nucleotidase, NT5C type [Desulfitobacteriia bacterium]
MKLKIGLDIDGVVADSFPVFRAELNKYYGKNKTCIDNYNIAEVYGVAWEEIGAFFEKNVEYLFSQPQPMEGALETITSWLKTGHEIIYVTARGRGVEERITLEWFEKHKIPYKEIVFAEGKSKTFAVQEYKLDIFVDDFPSNALEIAALNVPVLLFDAPYNQGKLPQGVTRCYNWDDVRKEVEKKAS